MIDILKSGLLDMKNDLKNGNLKKQIANLLTLSRFFSPFILLPLYYLNNMKLFIIMIVIFFLTDTFDGYFARHYNSVNLFGKYLDAVVDKIFVTTLLIPVLNNYFIIIIFFELLITIVNIYEFYKNLNPTTKYIGKVKTTILFILIGILYLRKFITFNYTIILITSIITIILQLFTLITYSFLIIKKR